MKLSERINADLKAAMKAKEAKRLTAIRAIKAAILTEKTKQDAVESEEADIKILQKLVKQRQDSEAMYRKAGRTDLAEEEKQQIDVIKTYLPKQIDDAILNNEIQKIVTETGAQSMKDMGKVMGLANAKLAGKAEGKRIADTVKKLLA